MTWWMTLRRICRTWMQRRQDRRRLRDRLVREQQRREVFEEAEATRQLEQRLHRLMRSAA